MAIGEPSRQKRLEKDFGRKNIYLMQKNMQQEIEVFRIELIFDRYQIHRHFLFHD